MKRTPLYFPFVLAILMTLFNTAWMPHVRLMTFAPFFALSYYRLSFPKVLWLSFGCGLLLDLLSSEIRFGLYALGATVVSALLYTQKRHFLEDKPLALSLFSALVSCTWTLFLLNFTDFSVRAGTVMTDLFLMPALDGLYAFLWFTCPMRMYIYIEKKGWRNLFKKAEPDEN